MTAKKNIPLPKNIGDKNMANVVSIKVDEAVYEYSCFVWGLISKENPKVIVTQLSEGKGVVGINSSSTEQDLLALITRSVLFVPRVRLAHDYGYRQENARWHTALLNKKRSLRSKVVYLTEAVNQIITKPYNEEITRLRQSISAELQAQKDGKQLTPEQTAKVEEVNNKIAGQRKLLRGLPRCTNQILTTLLHEYVDTLSDNESEAIRYNMQVIASQEAKISETKAKLKTQEVKDDSEKCLELESLVDDAVKKIEDCKKKCREIRTKYYKLFHEKMIPQVIADQLTKYAATSWEAFNINLKMIEENVVIKSPIKPTKEEEGEKKISRKQPTSAERGEALLLFPYMIVNTNLDEQSLADIANDLQVTEEYNQWARKFTGKEYTPEYQQAYEGFRKQLRTLPEKKVPMKDEKSSDKGTENREASTVQQQSQIIPISTDESMDKEQTSKKNHEELLNYMEGLSRKLPYGDVDFHDPKNRDYMQKFAERPDYRILFERIKSHESEFKKFSYPMQYIRNVVLKNHLEWSTQPVQ